MVHSMVVSSLLRELPMICRIDVIREIFIEVIKKDT